jgi:hypothetical protein
VIAEKIRVHSSRIGAGLCFSPGEGARSGCGNHRWEQQRSPAFKRPRRKISEPPARVISPVPSTSSPASQQLAFGLNVEIGAVEECSFGDVVQRKWPSFDGLSP